MSEIKSTLDTPEASMKGYVTTQINPDKLPDYLKAASKTGFKVAQIAGEGEEFPAWEGSREAGSRGHVGRGIVLKGNIAVSITEPEGNDPQRGHSYFWRSLESLSKKI